MGGEGSGRRKRINSSALVKEQDFEGLQTVIQKMATRLSPTVAERGTLSRAWQWKMDLSSGEKTKMDLINELSRATGEAYYKPGAGQRAFHESTSRVKQVVGGWRAGKSKSQAAELLYYMFRDNSHVWNVGNDYVLARPEFDYVLEWLRWLDAPITQISTPAMGGWTVVLQWGARLESKTADDIRKLEAAALDACGIAEAGQVSIDVLTRLRGRVTEKRGPILMAGSLEAAEQWYIDSFETYINGPDERVDWHAFKVPSWENEYVFPEGRDDPEIKNLEWSLPEDIFKLKVCAEIAKPQELVFPEFDQKIHLVKMEFTDESSRGHRLESPEPIKNEYEQVIGYRLPRTAKVEIAVDPGYAGAYSVLAIQAYDDQIFVIDEVYLRGHTVEDVISECKLRWWWPRVHAGVIDIAARQHQGMKSHVEIWADPSWGNLYLQSEWVPIPDGIQRLRTFLVNPQNKRPRVFFSRTCKGILDEFRLYRYRVARDNRPEREEPIDANNHSIKALSYWMIGRFGSGDPTRTRVTTQRYIRGEGEVASFNKVRAITPEIGIGWGSW